MVFHATFNNISVISWWSVLLVEETGETADLPQVTDKLLSHNVVSFKISYIDDAFKNYCLIEIKRRQTVE
jgi:hypothetical protein